MAEVSYITAQGVESLHPKDFCAACDNQRGVKIVPIVACRQQAVAGLCNGASQCGVALPGMAGLLRGCGSPGHSPTRGRAAAVPVGEEGCPSHSPNAQLGHPKS